MPFFSQVKKRGVMSKFCPENGHSLKRWHLFKNSCTTVMFRAVQDCHSWSNLVTFDLDHEVWLVSHGLTLLQPSRANVIAQIFLRLIEHTWVHYPGFWTMSFSVQYWPRRFRDFPPVWLSVPLRGNGARLEIRTLPEKNLAWSKLFRDERTFSQRRTLSVRPLWWQIDHVQELAHEWKNRTILSPIGLAEAQSYYLKRWGTANI